MENYEEKYKEALEKAKNFFNSPRTCFDINQLTKIFPELRESEDERIRKELIAFLNHYHTGIGRTVVYNHNWIYWLEKQGEQKPSDKIEPKFKVGDWVVNKYGDSWHIDSFDKKNYQVSDGEGNYNYFSIAHQDKMRLWTIQDADDGDVLANNGNIILFKGILNSARKDYKYIKSHCMALIHSFNFYTGGSYNLDDGFHPATKEQRDLLFQKMKEVGYEWDAEKKELKEIEQKPAWSKEDEQNLNGIVATMEEDAQLPKDTIKRLCKWLKSIKDRVQPQLQQEWSEKDEKKIMWLVRLISTAGFRELDNDKMPCSRSELLDWLKSLKPRWKPTKEQMESVNCAMNNATCAWHAEQLESLYNDLKSL